MFAIRGHHGRESEGNMNMFRVEAAAGTLPLHRLSCKAEDDVKSERDAHDLKDPMSRLGSLGNSKVKKKRLSRAHCAP